MSELVQTLPEKEISFPLLDTASVTEELAKSSKPKPLARSDKPNKAGFLSVFISLTKNH